eukprot:TRINITY_DN8551_c0_g1_i1.p1 TRINITY_DN8551_c0_g1~~TRINITY_DN8551_c0_g1_i1.p1  ORF type:complete len:155 (-),score=54.35 TRINITY_DN8551_c0_g1_i1:262-726(-)
MMSEEAVFKSGLSKEDSLSSATSLGGEAIEEEEEKSITAFEPTRESLSEGILSLLRPTLTSIDSSVNETRAAQAELKGQIDKLLRDLNEIAAKQNCPLQLEHYVEKLQNSKRKVLVVSNILQAAQERLNRIHALSMKETAAKRRNLLEQPSSGQ